MPLTARDAAVGALRWVAGAAVPAEGGVSWPEEPGYDQLTDELYGGTAGVLIAFAEARLSGISEFDDLASAAVGRIQTVAAAETDRLMRMSVAGGDGPLAAEELGLYTGLAGHATALGIWADVAGDTSAGAWARTIALGLATAATQGPALSDFRDLLLGEAGLVVAMLRYGGDDAAVAAGVIADRLVTQAEWIDDGPDWRVRADFRYLMPNFSHGAAGVGYALALAGAALDRSDLLDVARAAGRRLVRLGSRPDGTLAVPHSIPLQDPSAPVSYGWCHGPTGTVRLFQQLDLLCPGEGWSGHAAACRRAVRDSGLPARLYAGFWDNLGQCCGTAGVGELALDCYQESGDLAWLEWAGVLARDVLDRSICDQDGIRWSHTEHRVSPSALPPTAGWMQGAAGIAAWLLRLSRVRDDAAAYRITWPDRPPL